MKYRYISINLLIYNIRLVSLKKYIIKYKFFKWKYMKILCIGEMGIKRDEIVSYFGWGIIGYIGIYFL